ncbi:MAG: hypothetical protein JWO02_1237 [Solirubrobacterales bacterium]|nr:hypothetical protein [Solirubrobacterales bacterium]
MSSNLTEVAGGQKRIAPARADVRLPGMRSGHTAAMLIAAVINKSAAEGRQARGKMPP